MQREIKFRAWNGSKIYDWEHIYANGGLNNFMEMPEMKLMQYIGLKDKNGVEIYEGDVIKACHWDDCDTNLNRTWYTLTVKWNEENLRFGLTPDNKFDKMYGTSKYYQVIGNIYQNPELIT